VINPTPDTEPTTLINAFEIRGDDVEPFVQEWRKRAELLRGQPGFRSRCSGDDQANPNRKRVGLHVHHVILLYFGEVYALTR